MTQKEAERIANLVQKSTEKALTECLNTGIIKYNPNHGPDGRFCSGSGGGNTFYAPDGAGGGYSSTGTSFGGASAKEFSAAVGAAKKSVNENIRWRVTEHSADELEQHYQGAKLHITEGGSTVAVTTDGDIISVCAKDGDSIRGRDLLNLAVENGGTKLDAYSGLYGFYRKCGFEPVSWCKFDEQWAPKDWKKGRDSAESIIFWKYTGNVSTKSTEELIAEGIEFCKDGTESADYDEAQAVRDRSM